jgi:hypothetical protein
MGDGPCCFLAPPVFLLVYESRKHVVSLASPAFVLAERGRGVGGERGERSRRRDKRGLGASSWQARPAQRAVRRTKKGRQGGKWRGVALLWRLAPPLLWWPMVFTALNIHTYSTDAAFSFKLRGQERGNYRTGYRYVLWAREFSAPGLQSPKFLFSSKRPLLYYCTRYRPVYL